MLWKAGEVRWFTNFNSRPCERGDEIVEDVLENREYFNSRPCERVDRTDGPQL